MKQYYFEKSLTTKMSLWCKKVIQLYKNSKELYKTKTSGPKSALSLDKAQCHPCFPHVYDGPTAPGLVLGKKRLHTYAPKAAWNSVRHWTSCWNFGRSSGSRAQQQAMTANLRSDRKIEVSDQQSLLTKCYLVIDCKLCACVCVGQIKTGKPGWKRVNMPQ